MANEASHKRLQREYMKIMRDPPPYITAVPLPTNILEWHFCVTGPEDTVYKGGYYHGKLIFPKEYPFKPPAIIMITPSGRFKCNMHLCLSLSDFHPENWNPNWSVSTALVGLLSFMLENTPTTGSIETTDQRKRELAYSSASFNIHDKIFRKLFPELTAKLEVEVELRRKTEKHEIMHLKKSTACPVAIQKSNTLQAVIVNLVLLLISTVFVYIVLDMISM